MCLCCKVLNHNLCCCCYERTNARRKREKKKKVKTPESPKTIRYSRKNDPSFSKRSEKTLSQISDKELLKPIVLPTTDCTEPLEYLKKQKYIVFMNESLGTGGYGQVFKATHLEDNGTVTVIACKTIQIREGNRKEKMLQSLRTELYTLERLKYYHIIQLIKHFVIEYITGSQVTETKAFIFMEFATEGDLEHHLQRDGPFSNDVTKRYFGQIATALRYMHKEVRIAHRDLKLENILLVKSKDISKDKDLFDCKISDFGLSQMAYKEGAGYVKANKYLGTRLYMAPEILKMKLSDYKIKRSMRSKDIEYEPMPADCWAVGVIGFRLLTKEYPFDLSEKTDWAIRRALDDQRNRRYTYPSHLTIDKLAKEMVRRCLDPDPHRRYTDFDIISHPWLFGEQSLTADSGTGGQIAK